MGYEFGEYDADLAAEVRKLDKELDDYERGHQLRSMYCNYGAFSLSWLYPREQFQLHIHGESIGQHQIGETHIISGHVAAHRTDALVSVDDDTSSEDNWKGRLMNFGLSQLGHPSENSPKRTYPGLLRGGSDVMVDMQGQNFESERHSLVIPAWYAGMVIHGTRIF